MDSTHNSRDRQIMHSRIAIPRSNRCAIINGHRNVVDNRVTVNLVFTGPVPHNEIPDMLNCVDLLVLPSSLEGLPLVVIEALSCGAHVVATNVIGTAEPVGRENAIDLGDNFVDRFTDRAVQLLRGGIDQQLPPEVSWTATAEKEKRIYEKYLNK